VIGRQQHWAVSWHSCVQWVFGGKPRS
jgi:hypothetical protein